MSKTIFVSNEDVAVLQEYLVRPDTADVLALVPSLVSALAGPIVDAPPIWNLQEAVSACRSNTNYPEDYDAARQWLVEAGKGDWVQNKMLEISEKDADTLKAWTTRPETDVLYVALPSLRAALDRPVLDAPPISGFIDAVSAVRSNTNYPEDYNESSKWLNQVFKAVKARALGERQAAEVPAPEPASARTPVPLMLEQAPEVPEPNQRPACVCGSRRMAHINSMARDCNFLNVPHLKYSNSSGGYLPRICPGTSGDGFNGAICLDCGRVQGKFPVSDESIEEVLQEYREEDDL